MSEPTPGSGRVTPPRADTLAVRGGLDRSPHGETSEALYLTSGYVYSDAAQAQAAIADELDRFTYTRFGNPTTAMFEERLRAIEGAPAAQATASGMAAVFAAIASVTDAGDRVVAARGLFGATRSLLDKVLARWGVVTEYVDGTDLDAWEAALATPARVVYLETPSNPTLDVVDVAAVSELAHRAGAIVVVDNVFATPILQRPLELGADVVVYSATKHIDGQGRVLGGAVLGSVEYVTGPVRELVRTTGPTLNPFAAWVLVKGLETMPLRVRHASATALDLAAWLETRPEVARVRYPFLASHPQHDLARRQMSAGGTMVAFDLVTGASGAEPDGDRATAFGFLDALRLVDLANNLGDAKSLITHPATTTHAGLTREARAEAGIGETTIRFSVGLEDVEDLRADLAAALGSR